MAASVFGAAHLAGLFDAGEAGRLFSDGAEIRAMLLVEGALAKVQGDLGVIPELSAKAIHRASLEIQLDPAGLRAATAENGVVIPALVSAFRTAMEAPEHAQFVHWGATSQDIIDTGLMLRLRQALGLAEGHLKAILTTLGAEARAHADTPMVARTWGQQATPTTWGAVLAQWGQPLLQALSDLPDLRARAICVSLSGAAGTGSALGPYASETRSKLAEALGLSDPGHSWHADRRYILSIAQWFAQVSAALGSLGQGVQALTASEVAELRLAGTGASSTMPQKQNPVQAVKLQALNTFVAGQMTSLQIGASTTHQRDGAAWMTEWLALPQLVLAVSTALETAQVLVRALRPEVETMRARLENGDGFAFAEALSFALARQMPRPDAQSATKALIAQARETGRSLTEIAQAAHPDLSASVFDPRAQTGQAPSEARAFADRCAGLGHTA